MAAQQTQQTGLPTGNPLFPLLVAKYGLSGAIQILNLINPDAPAVNKGIGAASLAGQGARLAGGIAGNPALSSLGSDIGVAGNIAGTGLGIYQTATDPNLSTKQKAGHAAGIGANAIASSVVPYYWIGALAKGVADQLRASGSPQLRTAGKTIAAPALPVEGLLNVLSGDKSPRAAFNNMVSAVRDTPGLKQIASPILDLLGLGTKPTTGTEFRQGLQGIFGKVGLQNFNRADKNLYNAPKTGAVSPDSLALGAYIGSFAPGFNKNPEAYANQTANILTNTYGKNLPGVLKGTEQKLQLTPAEAMARFQSLGLGKDFLNKLQQGSVLFGTAVPK